MAGRDYGERVEHAELLDDGWLVLRRVKPLHGLPRYVITFEHGDEVLVLHDSEGRSIAMRAFGMQRLALGPVDELDVESPMATRSGAEGRQ